MRVATIFVAWRSLGFAPHQLPWRTPRVCVSSLNAEKEPSNWVGAAVAREVAAEHRKLRSLEKEAAEAAKAEALGKWAQLVVANMYRLDDTTSLASVEDWETGEQVELRFDKPPRIAADEAFAKARRLRRGSTVVEGLMAKSRARLVALESVETEDEALSLGLRPIPDVPARDPVARAKPKAKRKWTGRTFTAPDSGVPVLVGRNRRENDYLSCVVAKPGDVWLHARGAPGAHVVVQFSKRRGADQPREDLQFAANLAAFYSDFRTETKAWVSRVDPKHLWKPPKAPVGAVAIKKEDSPILGFPDQVPPDLVAQRDKFVDDSR